MPPWLIDHRDAGGWGSDPGKGCCDGGGDAKMARMAWSSRSSNTPAGDSSGLSRSGAPAPSRTPQDPRRGTRAHRRVRWVPVLLIGIVLCGAVQYALAVTANPNLVPSLLLLGALVVPVTFLVYVEGRNPAFDVPLVGLLLCGVLGGVLGVVASGLGEADLVRRLGAAPTLGVGVIEEAAKLVVPLAVLLFTRYRAVAADGLLVGVAVGVGFAVLETMGYGFTVLITSHGDLAATEEVLLVRGLLSPASHATWTGLTAAALWRVYAQSGHPRALLRLSGIFVLVIALHTAWDTFPTPWTYVVVGVLSLGLLMRQVHRDLLPTPPANLPIDDPIA